MFRARLHSVESVLSYKIIHNIEDRSGLSTRALVQSLEEGYAQKVRTKLEQWLIVLFTQQDNTFEYRGRDAEDNGTRWWEAQWAKDEEKARREKEQREAIGEEEVIEKNQKYFPTTNEELEAFTWYQQAQAHEREKIVAKRAAAKRSAAEKQREEVCKAIPEAEPTGLEKQQACREAKGGSDLWAKLLLK